MSTDTSNSDSLLKAAEAFGLRQNASFRPIGSGLINSTFLAEATGKEPLLLQQINTTVFPRPFDIQYNYDLLSAFLQSKNYFIPPLQKTTDKKLLWQNAESEIWRAFRFIPDSFSPDTISTTEDATAVTECFGRFAATLKDFPADKLKVILPGFHDLRWRYRQFEEAIIKTRLAARGELLDIIHALQERKPYVDVFLRFQDENFFPLHVMHHDCKISNILFHQKTKAIICPVDLDTVQPGKFFSDLGDMVRTMCCTVDENNTDWNKIGINEDLYDAILSNYKKAAGALFTDIEKANLHYSGVLLIYMQALRFLADYLHGNIYYKVQDEEQNLKRAKNQLLLLQSLERVLQKDGILPNNFS